MQFVRHLTCRQMLLGSAALLAIAGLLLFGRTLSYQFVELDDSLLILENAAVQSFSFAHLKTIFTTFDPELYIPLTLLSYAFDVALGGLHPFLFHLHNLADHIANAWMVGLFCYLLMRNKRAAMIAAVLFLVHPIQAEAVIWATGRKDLLSTVFFLLSLLLYIAYKKRNDRRCYAGSIGAFLLALLSKVTVVTLPVILLLLDWHEGRRVTMKSLTEKLPYFALSIVFGIVALFGKADAPDLSIVTRVLVAAKSFTFTMSKIALPIHLSPMYEYAGAISLTSPDFLFSIAVCVGLLAAMIIMRNRWKMFVFSAAFVMITMAPSFWNLVKNGDFYLTSDRYAYIPLIGVVMFVAWLIAKSEERLTSGFRNAGTIFGSALIAIYACMTFAHVSVWKDSLTLSAYVAETWPAARLGRMWHGNALRDAGDLPQALDEYAAALELKDDAQVRYNRALAYEADGKPELAKADYEKAIELRPQYALAHINLGELQYQANDKEAARKNFEAAMREAPQLAMPYYNLGVIEGAQRNFEKAADYYTQALDRDPNFGDAGANLAIVLLELRKPAEAVERLKETLRRDPENATANGLLQKLIDAGIVNIK